MYKKSKHKRRTIKLMRYFETNILPYIFTGITLFLIFIIAIASGIRFSSVGNMILWVVGVGLIVGSILLDFFKMNITEIMQWSFKIFDLFEKKKRKREQQ